jgi:hypothetical protein
MGSYGSRPQDTLPTGMCCGACLDKEHSLMREHKIEDSFSYALSSNAAWAGYKAHQNPQFFPKMSQGQSPSIRTSHPLSHSLPTYSKACNR